MLEQANVLPRAQHKITFRKHSICQQGPRMGTAATVASITSTMRTRLVRRATKRSICFRQCHILGFIHTWMNMVTYDLDVVIWFMNPVVSDTPHSVSGTLIPLALLDYLLLLSGNRSYNVSS